MPSYWSLDDFNEGKNKGCHLSMLNSLLAPSYSSWASLVPQLIKNMPSMQETSVQSLGQEDILEKGMAIDSNTLSGEFHGHEESGRLQSMASQRIGHNWATNSFLLPYSSWPNYFPWTTETFMIFTRLSLQPYLIPVSTTLEGLSFGTIDLLDWMILWGLV